MSLPGGQKGSSQFQEFYYNVLPSIRLPSGVVGLVSEPPDVVPGLQLPHVAPALVVLQPGVHQGLVHGVSLPELDLHRLSGERREREVVIVPGEGW